MTTRLQAIPGHRSRCTCPTQTKKSTWYTVVLVTSGVDPEDDDSETVIDWVKARCAVEACARARVGQWFPAAIFHGRRKGL